MNSHSVLSILQSSLSHQGAFSGPNPLHTDLDTARVLRFTLAELPRQRDIRVARWVCLAHVPTREVGGRIDGRRRFSCIVEVRRDVQLIVCCETNGLRILVARKEKRNGDVGSNVVVDDQSLGFIHQARFAYSIELGY